VLKALGSERAWVVHGRDGLDEITAFDVTHVAELHDGTVREFELDPKEVGLAHTERADIAGADATANAEKIRSILGGQRGAARDIVLLNTAAALSVAGAARDLKDGVKRAAQAIDSGAAAEKLNELAAFRG
jgi:anthranilate phosphoribosyltransferase